MTTTQTEPKWRGVLNIGGKGYRYGKQGRWWIAERRCYCLLGPHWHRLGVLASSVDALRDHITSEGD